VADPIDPNVPPTGALLAQATPASPGWSGLSVRLTGLRREADEWQRQGENLALLQQDIQRANFNVNYLGPFADFVNEYDKIQEWMANILGQGARALKDTGDALRVMANKYGDLDQQLNGNIKKAG
jgi:hypothetical protein